MERREEGASRIISDELAAADIARVTSRPLEVFRPIHFRIGPSIVTPLLDSRPSNLIFLAEQRSGVRARAERLRLRYGLEGGEEEEVWR